MPRAGRTVAGVSACFGSLQSRGVPRISSVNCMSEDLGRTRPVWRQVAAVITARIAEGAYPVGGKVPSVVELSTEFGIAASTAQKALTHLKAEGHPYRGRARLVRCRWVVVAPVVASRRPGRGAEPGREIRWGSGPFGAASPPSADPRDSRTGDRDRIRTGVTRVAVEPLNHSGTRSCASCVFACPADASTVGAVGAGAQERGAGCNATAIRRSWSAPRSTPVPRPFRAPGPTTKGPVRDRLATGLKADLAPYSCAHDRPRTA